MYAQRIHLRLAPTARATLLEVIGPGLLAQPFAGRAALLSPFDRLLHDRKRMSEISREAKELAKRARERKLRPEEFTGSTFSVSNLGMFGIDQFTAIINPPEAGILAIGTSEDKLVVVDGEPVVRNRVRVTMSCDHRIIDGAVGAKFLQTLRRLIENPLMLVY